MTLEETLNVLEKAHQQLAVDPRSTPESYLDLERAYNKALSQFPNHPTILFGLANCSSKLDRNGLAIALYKQSIDCGASDSAPLLNMGIAYKCEHMDENAATCYRKAIELADQKPILVDGVNRYKVWAMSAMAGLHINAGRPNQCIYWCEEALKLDPTDRSARWNLGLAHLEAGDWEKGFKLYDDVAFLSSEWKASERKLKTYGGLPQWDGTPGQTVICYGEQGVGDEVMFASMLPDLMKQCNVIIDCDKRLEKLFRESFPDAVAVYPTSGMDDPYDWVKDHEVHAFLPMGSLGRWFRKKDADFPRTPFLRADDNLRGKWRDILSPYQGLKVGISWAGGLKQTRFDKRTIILERFEGIIQIPNTHIFSLQYHPWAADACAEVGSKYGLPIHHWGDVIKSYDETAAFLMELDLLVTVNTSLLHLAGALGVPTLCLTPKMVAWRYGCRGPNPWYGSVQMLRQSEEGDWGPVLRKAHSEIERKARKLMKVAA